MSNPIQATIVNNNLASSTDEDLDIQTLVGLNENDQGGLGSFLTNPAPQPAPQITVEVSQPPVISHDAIVMELDINDPIITADPLETSPEIFPSGDDDVLFISEHRPPTPPTILPFMQMSKRSEVTMVTHRSIDGEKSCLLEEKHSFFVNMNGINVEVFPNKYGLQYCAQSVDDVRPSTPFNNLLVLEPSQVINNLKGRGEPQGPKMNPDGPFVENLNRRKAKNHESLNALGGKAPSKVLSPPPFVENRRSPYYSMRQVVPYKNNKAPPKTSDGNDVSFVPPEETQPKQ